MGTHLRGDGERARSSLIAALTGAHLTSTQELHPGGNHVVLASGEDVVA